MKHLHLFIALCLFGLSSTTFAAYPCPAESDSSGGWMPSECSQKQMVTVQSTCPDPADTRGGWVPPACTSKKISCPDCGVIEKINVVDESATGLGAAAGAVAGGLIGRKLGKDNKTLSTAIGAVAGALADIMQRRSCSSASVGMSSY